MPEPIAPSAVCTSPRRCVFVYGTLRAGDDNDITLLKPAPVFVGHASIAGQMFHLGLYPGVVLQKSLANPQEAHSIVGEVYTITDALERVLDAIESEYPAQADEYAKRDILVQMGDALVPCITYEINPRYVLGKPLIASGDWVKDR